MSLRKLARRLQGLTSPVTDTVSSVSDAVSSAEDWLRRNAPSLLSAPSDIGGAVRSADQWARDNLNLREALRPGVGGFFAEHAPAVTSASQAAERATPWLGTLSGQPDVLLGGDPYASTGAPLWQRPFQVMGDIQTVGNELAGEPLAYGIARLGGGHEALGGPFSGTQLAGLRQGAEELNNPLARTAARAGVGALEQATNPMSYLTPGAGTAAGLGRAALQAGVLGAGQSVGSDLGGAVGGDIGATVGGLVGGGAALKGAGAAGLLGTEAQHAARSARPGTVAAAPSAPAPSSASPALRKLANRLRATQGQPPLPPHGFATMLDDTAGTADRLGEWAARLTTSPAAGETPHQVLTRYRGAVSASALQNRLYAQAAGEVAPIAAAGATPTAARAAQDAALLAAHPEGTPAGDALRRFLGSPTDVALAPRDFTASPTTDAGRALGALQQADAGLRRLASDAGLGPSRLRERLGSVLWPDLPPGQSSPATVAEGLSRGLVPATLDPAALLEARAAGVTDSLLRQRLVELTRSTSSVNQSVLSPWLLEDADLARRQGTYLPLSRANLGTFADAIRAEGGFGASPWIRKDVARYLGAQFGTSDLAESTIGRVIADAGGAMRQTRLSADISQPARAGIAAALKTGAVAATSDPLHPWRGFGVAGQALLDAIRPGGVDDLLRTPAGREAAFYLHLTPRGEENPLLGQPIGQGLARIPVVGKPLQAMEDFQFNRFLPALQVRMYTTLVDSLRSLDRFRSYSDPELKQFVGDAIARTTGHVDTIAQGSGPSSRYVQRLVMLSPAWTRGLLGEVKAAAAPGPEGYLARRFLVGGALGLVATSAGLTAALSGDVSPDHLRRLLDPTSDESVSNPRSSSFLSVQLPNGTSIGIGGSWTSLYRSLLAPAAGGIGEGVAGFRAAQRDGDNALRAAVVAGLTGAAGGVERWRDWIESRRSIPAGLLMDLRANQDVRGRAIATADDSGQRALQRLAYAGTQLVPGVGSTALDTDTSALPQGVQERRSLALRSLGEFVGLNVRPPSEDPGTIKRSVTAFLAGQGIAPGADPVGRYRQGTGIDTGARQAFQATTAGQQVEGYLRSKRREAADNVQRPAGRDAVRRYSGERARLQDQLRADIAAANTYLHTPGASGDAWRQRVDAAWGKYIAGSETLAHSILGVDSLDQADALQARAGQKQGALDLLLERYHRIQPADDSPEQRDAMLSERRAFVRGLAPEQRSAFEQYMADRARALGGQDSVDYYHAQQVMGQLADIPPFLGMDAQTGRQVSQALSRAAEMARMKPGMSTTLAILLDHSIPSRIKALAMSKPVSNPQRQLLYQRNAALLGRFYSSVPTETLAQFSLAPVAPGMGAA